MADETYSAEQVDQLLRCPVCLDKYKEPKILPCQHTFCRSPCLEGLVDMRTRIIRCPECRMEHFVPIDGAAGFPTNITLINFLDLQAQPAAQLAITARPSASSETSTTVGSTNQCGVCEKEAETTKCAHCEKFACAACKKSHTNQMKFDIGRVVNQIRRGVPKLSNAISGVEQKSEQVRQHVETIKAEVRATIERYVKELKDREMLLHSELETFQQGEIRNLRLHQENLEVELASISSYCDSTEGTLNQSGDDLSDSDLVNLKRQCAEYMDQVNQSETNTDISGSKQVRFVYEGQNLQNCVSNFGELVVSMPGTSSGGGRRNSDSSLHDRDVQLSRRRWSEAQPMDSVFLTSADLDSLDLDSPRRLSPPRVRARTPERSPPVPALRSRLSQSNQGNGGSHNSSSVYTAPSGNGPSDVSMGNPVRNRGTWNHNRASLPNTLQAPWRPPNRRDRSRDALTGGYMFHMTTSTSAALREELERIREMELLSGAREQIDLTRQIDQSMARQNRIRNQASNVAALFGQEPREWAGRGRRGPVGDRRMPRQGNNNNHSSSTREGAVGGSHGNRQVAAVRRVRSHDERPAGVAGGVPPSHSDGPSPSPRVHLDPLPSSSSFIESPGNSPRESNNSQRGNNNNGNRAASNRATAQPVHRTAAVRRVDPGISFEVPLHTPEGDNRAQVSPSGGETYRAVGGSSSPQPGTSSQTDNPPQVPSSSTPPSGAPPPLRRQTTFTRDSDDPTNQNQSNSSGNTSDQGRNIPVVGDQSVSITLPVDMETDANNDTDDETTLTFRLSTSDSLTTMRPLNNYQIKGVPSRVIGNGRGSEVGKFSSPRGVAVSPLNDSIVVADSSNHRVQIFDVNGQFVSSFGSYGQEPGELDCISGLAVNTMGQIIVADRYNNRVQVFDRYGEHLHSFGSEGEGEGQMKQPWGLSCDLSGFIYVCDKGNNRIQVFTQDGTYVRQFGRNQLDSPNYVTVSEDNRVIVSDTNSNRIQIFNAQGRVVSTFGSAGTGSNHFKGPRGLAVDRQGFITVVDAGNSRIKVFRGDGRFFCAFGKSGSRRGHFKGAEGLALMSSGKVVVSDRDNHRIQIF